MTPCGPAIIEEPQWLVRPPRLLTCCSDRSHFQEVNLRIWSNLIRWYRIDHWIDTRHWSLSIRWSEGWRWSTGQGREGQAPCTWGCPESSSSRRSAGRRRRAAGASTRPRRRPPRRSTRCPAAWSCRHTTARSYTLHTHASTAVMQPAESPTPIHLIANSTLIMNCCEKWKWPLHFASHRSTCELRQRLQHSTFSTPRLDPWIIEPANDNEQYSDSDRNGPDNSGGEEEERRGEVGARATNE